MSVPEQFRSLSANIRKDEIVDLQENHSAKSAQDSKKNLLVFQVDINLEEIALGQKINVYFKDITNIISLDQEQCDKRYQDAMEANYSHEQMTPLNCILGNGKILLAQIQKLMSKGSRRSAVHYKELQDFQKQNFDLNKQIMYSAQILQFYNMNQIEKMKVNKGELIIKEMCSLKPEQFIEEVLQPFEYQIKKKKMKVSIQRKDVNRPSIKADWRLYQLIIFNIIQNAVKYNKKEGTISVTTELKDSDQNLPNEMTFVTIIQDDGKGIQLERIPNLFKVFGELKH